jgi:hypothetical protein
VDTPIFRRAANYSGRAVRAIPLVLGPETIAAGVVRCARSPRREVTYRYTARLLAAVHGALPAVHHRLLPSAFDAGTFRDTPAAHTAGTVLTPGPADYGVACSWNRARRAGLARAFGASVPRGAAESDPRALTSQSRDARRRAARSCVGPRRGRPTAGR